MCVGRNWRGDKRCIDEADYFNYVEICDASHGDTENIHEANEFSQTSTTEYCVEKYNRCRRNGVNCLLQIPQSVLQYLSDRIYLILP